MPEDQVIGRYLRRLFTGACVMLAQAMLGCETGKNTKEHENSIRIVDFPETGSLSCETVALPSAKLVNPWSLYLNDSLLVIKDKQGKDGLLLFINKKSDYQYLGAMGAIGSGPGEYLGLKKVDFSQTHLWVFDVTASTATRVNLDSALSDKTYIPKTRLTFRPPVINFAVIDDSLFLVGYYAGAKRFALVNGQGKIVETFLQYPELDNRFGVDSVTFIYGVRANIYQGKIMANRNKGVFAISYYFTGLIQIIDYKEKRIVRNILGPDNNHPPDYVLVGNRQSALARGAKSGYIDLFVTDNYIYALYSGKTDKLDITANRIFCFDWKGNPVSEFILGCDIIAFAVDEQKGKIYGVDFSDNPIKEFDFAVK